MPFRHNAYLALLVMSVVLVNFFIITTVGQSIYQSYHQYQEQAKNTAKNLTQTLESEISGAIKTDDIVLSAVIDEYKKQRSGGVDGKALNAYIERVRSRLPEIDALRIADAQGIVVYGSDVTPATKTNVADRPHFIRLRDDPKAGLMISKPQVSRVNGKWVIVFARRIDQQDGSFGGMAFAAITLDHFSRIFSALNVGPHGVVTLRDGELGVVARYPEPQGVGSIIGSTRISGDLLETVKAGQSAGTINARSLLDNIERTYSYRRIGAYPLYIFVGLAVEDYLAGWHKDATLQAGLAMLFVLITLLAAWLIYGFWKRQVKSIEALIFQETKFRTVADFTYDWEYWQGPDGRIRYMSPSCERVSGYTLAEFDADPGLLLRIVHPEDRHVMGRHLYSDLQQTDHQDVRQVEFRIVRRDGEIRWIAHHCVAVDGRNGEFEGLRVSNRDITERKRADDDLRKAQHSLVEAQRLAHIGSWELDLVHNRLTWSEEMYRIFGMPPEEFGATYETFLDTLHPDDRDKVGRAYISSVEEGGQYDIEYRIIRKSDGQLRWGHARGENERDANGKALRSFGTVQDITERKRMENAAEREHIRLQTILRTASDGIHILNSDGVLVEANNAFLNLLRYDESAIGKLRITDWDILASSDGVKERIDHLIARPDQLIFETRFRRLDGVILDVEISAVGIKIDGEDFIYASSRDITDRKKAEEELKLAARVFTHAREGIMITDPDGTIVDVNDAFTRITGYSREESLGRNPRFLNSGRQEKAFFAAMWRDLIRNGQWSGDVWNRRKNGEVFAAMQTIGAVPDADGNTRQYVSLFSDITQIKEHEKQLEHVAHYDALTALPNRLLLGDRLRQAMVQSQRHLQQLAVVYIDLDSFKVVNDLHGHDVGDHLLMKLSARMKQTLREGDTFARLGGDEFVAVLPDLADVAASVPMLTRLLAAAAQPAKVGDVALQVSSSIGVTFYPQTEDVDADQLLRQADQAMYQAKLAGKNRYHIFDAEQDRNVRGYHESLDRIHHALTAQEFVLHYQPKVNMRTGAVVGAEALIRWQHPEKGLLPPAMFLPVIEDHPLAVELGEWVINTVLTQIELWHEEGRDIPVSINIGARQLQQTDFVDRLSALLAAHPKVKPSYLSLEVLETSALEDITQAAKVIEACKRLGVMFALDDFGTGYSSLTYLRRLSVAQLKIDQSFVRDMLDDPGDLAILEGVLGLATAFRRDVIAEGVETTAHGELLLQLGCELAQGYGIAHPMPASELSAWAASWRPDPAWAGLHSLAKDDLPLLFASVEHRAWIVALGNYLKGESKVVPALDLHQCRFGKWLDTEGLSRYGERPSFHAVETLHQQVHKLAAELCNLQSRNQNTSAIARLGEMHALRNALLEQLKVLLTN